MAKSKSVSVPPTTLSPPSSVAQAAALMKPAKSVSTPAEPTYDVSGEPKIYTPDPAPHTLATRAREEAIPKVTAAMDALLQGKEIDRTAEEIFNEAFSTAQQPKLSVPTTTPAKISDRDQRDQRDQELIAAWEESKGVWPDYCRNVDTRDIQLQGAAARDFGVSTYAEAWNKKDRRLRRLIRDELRNAHTRQGKTFAPLKGRKKAVRV